MATVLQSKYPQINIIDCDNCPPPLKWAGGKRWLVPYVRKLWEAQNCKRLVEPFCGGLSIALGILPEEALLNDINPHAINFYKWLQKGLSIELKLKNDENVYYQYRARFNALISSGGKNSKEAAELFYYLNRTGYNGLCRFNKQGHFNVPFGRHTINYKNDFIIYKKICDSWSFKSTDFENLPLQKGDFVYADPPYDVEFTQYSKEGFSWEDQVRLAEWLAKHDGPVVLSNQATGKIQKLYKGLGFKLEFRDAPRRISCNGDRTKAEEVIALRGIKSAKEDRYIRT